MAKTSDRSRQIKVKWNGNEEERGEKEEKGYILHTTNNGEEVAVGCQHRLVVAKTENTLVPLKIPPDIVYY